MFIASLAYASGFHFPRKSNLAQHQNSHSGLQPLQPLLLDQYKLL